MHTDSKPRRGYDSWDRVAFDLLRAGIPYDLVDTAAYPDAPCEGAVLLVAEDTSVDDARLADAGWQVRRLRPDAGLDELITAGVLRPPVRLTGASDRCLAAATRSDEASYLHLVNWGELTEVALILGDGWPLDGWVDLTNDGQPVDLERIVLGPGHTVLGRSIA